MNREDIMLKRITHSPYLNFLSGVILLITAGYEVWESFGEISLGAHHGVAFFGIIQILKSIPEINHGLKELEEVEDN